MTPPLPSVLRNRIHDDLESGKDVATISEQTGVSKRHIRKMRQNKRDFGSVENLRPHKNYGRPPTLKEDAVEALLQWRRENPKASLPDMAQYLSSDFKLKVACSTIRDTLARASGTSKVKPRRAKKPSDSVGKDWRQELQMYLAAAGTINHSSSQATSSGTSP